MRVLICLILAYLVLMPQVCFGKVVLHHYTDKATGDERGTCYSDKDGNPAVLTPDRNVEVINESQKQYYIDLHNTQMAAVATARQTLINKEKGTARTLLKTKGFTDKEVDAILGDTSNILL